jgi:hypothetical protein
VRFSGELSAKEVKVRKYAKFVVIALVIAVVATTLTMAKGTRRGDEGKLYLLTSIRPINDDRATAAMPRAVPSSDGSGGGTGGIVGNDVRTSGIPGLDMNPEGSSFLSTGGGSAMMTPEQRAERDIRKIIRQLD